MMTESELTSGSLLDGYRELLPLMEASSPAHFSKLREAGLRTFKSLGPPTTRDEEFKYLPLRDALSIRYRFGFGANVTRADLTAMPLGDLKTHTIVFVNGQFAPELSLLDELPSGLTIAPFAEVDESRLEGIGSVATYEGKLGSTNDPRFVALNTAYMSEGAFIHIGRGQTIEDSIHILHLTTDDEPTMVYPRVFIHMDENSEATILESYISRGEAALVVPVTEVRLGASARLEHNRSQFEGEKTTHIANLFVHQEERSVYTSNTANFGAKIARNDINVWLSGEHTETWLNGVSVGSGEQILDNHTRIDHAFPNCESYETYKSVLDDRAVGVFNGKIFVYEDAQKTDAKQTNQAILLSGTATMNTKPQLEIFADDVKCTHGATIGQLREDALFYLQSRGIPAGEARALLVYAFAAENLLKISNETLRNTLETALLEKLA